MSVPFLCFCRSRLYPVSVLCMKEKMPQLHRVRSVPLPPESDITSAYASTSLADAYAVELPVGATTNPEQLARFIFSQPSPVGRFLLAVRDALVAGFGLKTTRNIAKLDAEGRAEHIDIFRIFSTSPTEIVLGEDDRHLDFRVSVLCPAQTSAADKRQVIVATVVHCHNRFGRFYIRVIAPFHRQLVRASLRRAARIGWPTAVAGKPVATGQDRRAQ